MTTYVASNNGYSTLSGALSSVATTLIVQTGHGDRFPVVISGTNHTLITLENAGGNIEIVKVTARAPGSNSMTIVRAQEGTAARAWNPGDIVECRMTAGVLNGKEESANKDASGGYAGLTGQAINLWNAAKTFRHFLIGNATANRNITFPDHDGTVLTDTSISAATSKAVPVDADIIPVGDSAASFGLKKLTWAGLKAELNTYFNTLYQAAGNYALLAGATYTGGINEARGAVAMHATTMNLWARPNVIDGTGIAVTITAIANAPQAGARRTLYPITGTTIVNGPTFAVEGAANYTTAAGDALEFEAVTTSTYKVRIRKYDGTPVVVVSNKTPAVPVRQTVLDAPVDANGMTALGGSPGTTAVTTTAISASAPLIVTAANGFDGNGEVNTVGISTGNLSWTGLSTNGTMYLYVDESASALTTGSTTLAPVYQRDGTYSTVSGQATFNISKMKMMVGTGITANQTNRVFVGEVAVAGGVVASIIWYALKGAAHLTKTTIAASTRYTLNHNIGTNDISVNVYLQNKTAELGYPVGARTYEFNSGSGYYGTAHYINSTVIELQTSGAVGAVKAVGSGTPVSLTAANWSLGVFLERAW